ncbi:MAG: ABC transporter permease, partial [Gemmataceae bacterium]
MTFLRLIAANLSYFWRGNLAVLLGVAVGCAVLTGALLVGDSLQGSLREQSARRLGWVTHSLVVPRFFRQALADQVAAKAEARVAPVLMLQATVKAGDAQARAVTVIGVTPAFGTEAGTSSALARTLGVNAGDKVTVRLQKASELPREAALARKEAETTDWAFDLGRVLTPADAGDAFNLRPELTAPHNLFVPLDALQKQLGLEGRVNALLAAGETAALQAALENALELDDWGLVLHTPASRAEALVKRYARRPFVGRGKGAKPAFPSLIADELDSTKAGKLDASEVRTYFMRRHPYLTLESRSLLLPDAVVKAALDAATPGLDAAPTLVYLCKIESGGETRAGVVAALDPAKRPPLGPFLPTGVAELKDDEIVTAGWTPKGKAVTLRFKPPES